MRGLTRRWWVLAASGLLVAGVIGQAAADPAPPSTDPASGDPISALLDTLTGNHDDTYGSGCRANLLAPTDDGSSASVALPFSPNFFGTRTHLFVNNNGNVTFGAARPDFHFDDLNVVTNNPMIAPFLADVDTRDVVHSQAVTYGVSGDQKVFCADWPGVGYYNNHGDKLDKFRLVLIDRSGDPGNSLGDFDIVMNYDVIKWDTADAKAPSVAAVARVGYSDGTGAANHSYQLPGSGTPGAFLDHGPNSLAEHSLVTNDQRVTALQNGRYIFAVRGGRPLPAGQPPTVQSITVHTAEDTPLHVNVPTTDPDGDVVVLRSATDGAHGAVTCTATAPIGCTYTPAANFHGTDSFRVNVADSHGNNATGTVQVIVDPINDPPTVVTTQSMSVSVTNPPTPVTRNVLAGSSDPDGDPVTLSAPLTPLATAHGSVTCTANGQCTYTPNATFVSGSTDSFPFTATDGNGGTTAGTVNITEHNDPPTAAFDARLQTANVALTVAFDASASHDPQGPIASYAWDFGDGTTGTGVTVTHTYTRPGTYQVRLTVTDSGGLTGSVTRSVRLRGNTTPPNNGGGHNPGGPGNDPGGPGNNPGGPGNNPGGPARGPGDGPRDHGPGRGPDDRGGFHGGGGRDHDRDHLELVNESGHEYGVHGTLRDGDFRIERDHGEIRRISGTGFFGDGSSVTFRLRVHHHRAFGTITVRDRDHVIDRFRVDGVRIDSHGDTVRGRARYQDGGGRFYFIIEDR
jgi:PKD repeat protein